MGIKDVGAQSNGSSPLQGTNSVRSRTKESAPQRESRVSGQEDFFENSGRLGAVRALIDGLVQAPEIRTEAVERARELLTSGELDSPESATKAARAFVEGSR